MAPPKGQQRPLGETDRHLLSRHSRLRLLHPADVSTLSGSDRKSVSTPLQRGVRFFRHPMPAPSTALLADCLPAASGILESSAMNRGFLVPCDAKRVLLRRDTSFRAGLSLGGFLATYSRPAWEYQPVVRNNSRCGCCDIRHLQRRANSGMMSAWCSWHERSSE